VRDKQMLVLRTIQEHTHRHGRPPSIRELCTALGLQSTSTIAAHLQTLERHGLLQSSPCSPRSRVLTAGGEALLAPGTTLTSVRNLLAQARDVLAALDAERIDHPYAGCLRALDEIAEGLEEAQDA
jgi:repressor LexA